MVSLYYSFIHSYFNNINNAWCSTSIIKLKKLALKQKKKPHEPFRFLVSESRSEQIIKDCCILNIYLLNIHNALNHMFKVKNGSIPDAFQDKFYLISFDYFTKNSLYNIQEPKFSSKITKFAISLRGSRLSKKNNGIKA